MARRSRQRDKVDQGRGFFETTSPFETYSPATNRGEPKTFTGLVDRSAARPNEGEQTGGGKSFLNGPGIMARMDPEQYDNPRGFPGLAMVTTGTEKSKLPLRANDKGHSITHHMEMGAALARTGRPGGTK